MAAKSNKRSQNAITKNEDGYGLDQVAKRAKSSGVHLKNDTSGQHENQFHDLTANHKIKQRLDALEAAAWQRQTTDSALEAKVAAIDGKVAIVDAKVATVEAQVAAVEAKVATVEAKIASLEAKGVATAAQVKAGDALIKRAATDIQGLRTAHDDLAGAVEHTTLELQGIDTMLKKRDQCPKLCRGDENVVSQNGHKLVAPSIGLSKMQPKLDLEDEELMFISFRSALDQSDTIIGNVLNDYRALRVLGEFDNPDYPKLRRNIRAQLAKYDVLRSRIMALHLDASHLLDNNAFTTELMADRVKYCIFRTLTMKLAYGMQEVRLCEYTKRRWNADAIKHIMVPSDEIDIERDAKALFDILTGTTPLTADTKHLDQRDQCDELDRWMERAGVYQGVLLYVECMKFIKQPVEDIRKLVADHSNEEQYVDMEHMQVASMGHAGPDGARHPWVMSVKGWCETLMHWTTIKYEMAVVKACRIQYLGCVKRLLAHGEYSYKCDGSIMPLPEGDGVDSDLDDYGV